MNFLIMQFSHVGVREHDHSSLHKTMLHKILEGKIRLYDYGPFRVHPHNYNAYFFIFTISTVLGVSDAAGIYSCTTFQHLADYFPIFFHCIWNCPLCMGPCHQVTASPPVVDGGTASNMEGRCEYIE
jgi:hypothetical protein